MKITKTGWQLNNFGISGDCRKNGKPYLFSNLNQDDVCYPTALEEVMENLWRKIDVENLLPNQIQPKFNKLSKWISDTNLNTPKFNFTKETRKKLKRSKNRQVSK